MKVTPEALAIIASVRANIKAADDAMEAAIIPIEPVVHGALARNDTEELNELVRVLPCAFWRAEIRGLLKTEGRWIDPAQPAKVTA